MLNESHTEGSHCGTFQQHGTCSSHKAVAIQVESLERALQRGHHPAPPTMTQAHALSSDSPQQAERRIAALQNARRPAVSTQSRTQTQRHTPTHHRSSHLQRLIAQLPRAKRIHTTNTAISRPPFALITPPAPPRVPAVPCVGGTPGSGSPSHRLGPESAGRRAGVPRPSTGARTRDLAVPRR